MTNCRKESPKNRVLNICIHTVGGIIILAGIVALTMWLWNMLIPDIFGGKTITYWQAMGLLVLTNLFIWPLRGHGKQQHDHLHKHVEEHFHSEDQEQEA